jgi:membrane associated rhomboid family serine protease
VFIPFGLEHSPERRPWATGALVAANVLVFVLAWSWPDEKLRYYALDPGAFRIHQLVTSTFLHAGILHLLGNMLFLWTFGGYVEDRLGPWRLLLVYFACAAVGDLAYLASRPSQPAVGASGATSGLMGYVLVAAPWLEVRVLLNIGFYVSRPYEIAAVWLLIPWILLELISASSSDVLGVAVFAHIGGFAFGVAAAAFMRSRYCLGTAWYIDPRPPTSGRAVVERLRRARGSG